MRKVVSFLFILLSSAAPLYAEDAHRKERHQLEKIVVTSSRIAVEPGRNTRSLTVLGGDSLDGSAYSAVPDVIGIVGGIDIRRRGQEGVQADVSIRGSTFEQNTVLIDGIKVNDPQTGHFTMDLPVTSADVERIEILKGPASSVYGPNCFGGVVNIITKRPDDKKITVNAAGGFHDYFDSLLSVSYPVGAVKNSFSFEESRSGGYMSQTEFNILSLADRATLETPFGFYDFLFGYLKKDFGADSFYSNLYPNEKENTDTRFFKIAGLIEGAYISMEPKLFLRRHRDKFALDSNRPGWQTNYHTTYDYGFEAPFRLYNQFMDVVYGFELSHQTIDSTNIQTHEKNMAGLYIELSPKLADNLDLNIGIREDRFSDFGWTCSTSIGASYMALKDLNLRALMGTSYRIPTFTDLYYRDSANIGNPDLVSENARSYEGGVDYKIAYMAFSGTIFRRDSEDTIDWIRAASSEPWRATNIGSARTYGLELSCSVDLAKIYTKPPVKKISLEYTALDTYAKHDYLSKYTLDYLKQHISAGTEFEFLGFRNNWVLNYKKRVGSSGYIVVDTKFSKEIARKDRFRLDAFLSVSNLFNAAYSELSGVPMPGRWLKSGARVEF